MGLTPDTLQCVTQDSEPDVRPQSIGHVLSHVTHRIWHRNTSPPILSVHIRLSVFVHNQRAVNRRLFASVDVFDAVLASSRFYPRA